MKKIIYCLLVAVMLSACGGVRREGEKRVGDIIMVNGELGVVFAITSDGLHGKAVSVSKTKCDWYDAKTWCANLGPAWKLPTIDELRVIYRNKAVINSALQTNGYATLSYFYWSSESHNEKGFCAWHVLMDNGNTGNYLKDSGNHVRAVAAF